MSLPVLCKKVSAIGSSFMRKWKLWLRTTHKFQTLPNFFFANLSKSKLQSRCGSNQSVASSILCSPEWEQFPSARSNSLSCQWGDCESDCDVDPQELVGVKDVLSSGANALVIKRRGVIQRKARKQKAKAIVQRRFLSRMVSKQTFNILANCLTLENGLRSMFRNTVLGQMLGVGQGFSYLWW